MVRHFRVKYILFGYVCPPATKFFFKTAKNNAFQYKLSCRLVRTKGHEILQDFTRFTNSEKKER